MGLCRRYAERLAFIANKREASLPQLVKSWINCEVLAGPRNLNVAFQPAAAVRPRSAVIYRFRLSRGETLAIVGESGSGKSVTALALMRLLDADGRRRSAARRMLLRRRNRQVIDLNELTCVADAGGARGRYCDDFSGADDLAEPGFYRSASRLPNLSACIRD